MSDAWLVIGLGNPGPRYETTRHNVGQLALDVIADRIGGSFTSHRTNSQVLEGRLAPGGSRFVLAKSNGFMNLEGRLAPGGSRFVLAKSNGFMNTSGGPVSGLAKYFDVPTERIIVLHDDLDLPFDTLKLKSGGGHGGHNGLRDIAKALGSPDFLRVRIGIGRPPGQQDAADFVLRPFAQSELGNLGVLLEDAADAVESLVTNGLLETQQRFHGRAAR